MKNGISLLFGLIICLFVACETTEPREEPTSNPTPSEPTKIAPETDATTVEGVASTDMVKKTPDAKQSDQPKENKCKSIGQAMEDNDLWIKEHDTWVCIVADSISKDMDFGDSYRIIDVYDTKNCQQVNRTLLPVNRSPDFPYYLFKETFENKNKVICTKGFEFTFCYDVENGKMLPRMKQRYMKKRIGEDAQSGMPLALSVWDNYLFGYAQDLGAYAFDIGNKQSPKPLIPVAEYAAPKTMFDYNALFLIEEKADHYQAVVPMMDEEEEVMVLKKLFKKPLNIRPEVARSVQNNRYLIFENLSNSKERIALDMQGVKRVPLPKEIAGQKKKAILTWLKKQK